MSSLGSSTGREQACRGRNGRGKAGQDRNDAVLEPQSVPPLALSVSRFCSCIGISRTTFYSLANRGEGPPTIKIGRRRMIAVDDARAWLRRAGGRGDGI